MMPTAYLPKVPYPRSVFRLTIIGQCNNKNNFQIKCIFLHIFFETLRNTQQTNVLERKNATIGSIVFDLDNKTQNTVLRLR